MTARITVELDSATLQSVEREAMAHGAPVSSYVRGGIQRHEIQLAQEAHRIPRHQLIRILEETLTQDAELYRRLARSPE